MDVLDLIKSDGYITLSKELARKIGLNETIVLMELISKHKYFEKNDKLDNQGFYYCTVADLQKSTTLNKYYQNKAITTLEELNLIRKEVKGIPSKRHFKINYPEIEKLFLNKGKKADNPRHESEENYSPPRNKNISHLESNRVSTNNNNNNNNKTEEEDAHEKKIPKKISTKFEQVFNRKISVELYNKLIKIYSDSQILMKSLQISEEQADKPKYLLTILKDWKEQNLTSVSEINQYLEKRQAKKKKNHRRSSTNTSEEHKKLHNVEELKAKGWN